MLRKPFTFIAYAAAMAIAISLVSGCSLADVVDRPNATEYKRVYSSSIPQSTPTALGRHLQSHVAAHKGQSGFLLLPSGYSSFAMRLALVQAAEKTLDLQYYLMNDDMTASLLLEAILRAADRGVRVRFLVDNINLSQVSRVLSVLDGNENIEVRVFNPMITRRQTPVWSILGVLTNVSQVTKRMHNKALIADNQLAIIGGRNLGDEYFDASADTTFNDLDILSAGPVTADISKSFDRYWNSAEAFPIKTLRQPSGDPHFADEVKRLLRDNWDEIAATEQGRKILDGKLPERIRNSDVKLIWAKAQVAADEPEKVSQSTKDAESKSLNWIEEFASRAKKEFVIVSAYFVPKDAGVAWLSGVAAKGVDVKILTNSLASTDVVAVHTGYEAYRRALVDGGISLYELKTVGKERPRQRLLGSRSPPHANLHGKVYVFDRRDIVIGSFNLDPRSVELNTEISLIIRSEELAAQIITFFEKATSPENSYRLMPGKTPDSLYWITRENGKEKKYKNDPKAGFGRELQVFFMSMLPIEDQL